MPRSLARCWQDGRGVCLGGVRQDLQGGAGQPGGIRLMGALSLAQVDASRLRRCSPRRLHGQSCDNHG